MLGHQDLQRRPAGQITRAVLRRDPSHDLTSERNTYRLAAVLGTSRTDGVPTWPPCRTGVTSNVVSPGAILVEATRDWLTERAPENGWGEEWADIERNAARDFVRPR
jgi:hypothetical protein